MYQLIIANQKLSRQLMIGNQKGYGGLLQHYQLTFQKPNLDIMTWNSSRENIWRKYAKNGGGHFNSHHGQGRRSTAYPTL